MLSLINWRLKVTINDGRALTGQMLAFDRHMNLVLADCEEFRRIRPKKKAGEETAPEQEMKRTLGLVILRGETVVSISVEGPPPATDDDKKGAVRTFQLFSRVGILICRDLQLPAGPGRGMPAGRGMGMMPPSMCSVTFSYKRCVA
jgi:small nuclear ribonucleoprotein B and B'